MTRRPDFFIIGAAKAGTTSVYEWLKGHPDVYMSPAKEPRYFAPDIVSGSPHDLLYGRDADRYMGLFDAARDEKRVGEASVRYLCSTDAPRLIHEFAPDARIVAMLRNPVDMIYALHNQRVSEGTEPITDFEAALDAEPERLAGKGVRSGRSPLLYAYRPWGRFGEQLQRWLDRFPRERVHVIIFEEMVRDPAPAFRALLEFLDVDAGYQPASFAAYNTSHAPRYRWIRQLTQARVPQWLTWRALPRIIGESTTYRLVRRYQNSPLNRRAKSRKPLRPELRRQLEAEFADDVAHLSRIVGHDLAEFWFRRHAQGQPAAEREAALSSN